METSVGFEVAALVVIVGILLFDVIRSIRHPHIPSHKQSLAAIGIFAGLAVIFGGILWALYGMHPAVEFYSGWLTEYSLSIDNLFVFMIIIGNFKVPKKYQKEALGAGIIIALICRAVFIALGAELVKRFEWIFFLFGAFLVYTAIKLLVDQEGDDEYEENFIVKLFHKTLPMAEKFDKGKLRTVVAGKKLWTPMLMVIVSLGVTDLFFAFDSIPAIFGLTKDPFIVFTTNVFALMGLQQLYFLLGGLVEKLEFLPLGLAIILAFIGFKLVAEAGYDYGAHWLPEIGNLTSLAVIIITIATTAGASVLKIKRDERRQARRLNKL
jgi:tellurite resistance protein TerC